MVTSDVLDFDINLIDNILSVNIKVKDYFPELALQWRVRLFYKGEVVKETDWVNGWKKSMGRQYHDQTMIPYLQV